MKRHILHTLSVVICVCGVSDIRAQYHSQMGLGNYGAVHSFYVNPSSHAYSAWLWQVHLGGVWANANNNYISLRLPYSAYRIPNRVPYAYRTESGNPRFMNEWLHENLNGRTKHASVSADVFGPAASFKVKSWRIGLFTHAAASIRITNVSESFAHALFKGLDSAQGAFNLFDLSSTGTNRLAPFSASGNSRAEAGVNLARSFKLAYNRQLTAGVSVKKVFGFQGFYFNSSALQVTSLDKDHLYVHPGSMHLVTYGDRMGGGAGVDIGVTYVFHKKDNQRNSVYAQWHTRYHSKLGFSIMDIGRITYRNAVFRDVVINGSGVEINTAGQSYSHVSNYDQAIDVFMKNFASYKTDTGVYHVGLPTRMVMSGDLQVRRNFFVGGLISQSLRKRNSPHNRYQSFAMVSPRFEYRYFEFSMPLVLAYDYRSLRVGSSFRIGPLYFGTSSLNGFVNTRNIRDVDFFVGLAFGNSETFSFAKLVRKRLRKWVRPRTSCMSF